MATYSIRYFGVAGTAVKRSAEFFVYWKDWKTRQFLGLNFVSATDARRFTNCCTLQSCDYLFTYLLTYWFISKTHKYQCPTPKQRHLVKVNSNQSRIEEVRGRTLLLTPSFFPLFFIYFSLFSFSFLFLEVGPFDH